MVYAKKRKPIKEKPKRTAAASASHSAAELPYILRRASVLYERTLMNTIIYYFMGVNEVIDWLDEHTPSDIQGCRGILADIEAQEKASSEGWSKFSDDIINKNRTLMMRFFCHPTLVKYRESLKNKVAMRASANHHRKPYLVGWCCLLHTSGRLLNMTVRQNADTFGDELRLSGIDRRLVTKIVEGLEVERRLQELLDPVSRLISRLLAQMGMDEATFIEYMTWADKNTENYAQELADLRLKDIRNDVCNMVDNENKNKLKQS